MNKRPANPVHILIADDDEDDQLLIREALEDGHISNPHTFFENGKQLLDYLSGEEKGPERFSTSAYLILLDLNMPIMDGRETLQRLKTSDAYKKIPVIVLTTSKQEEDILSSYDSGVNSYISKPVTFESLVDVMKTLQKYWLQVVEIPHG